MIHRLLLTALSLVTLATSPAALSGQQPALSVIVENVGASDRAIVPLVISTSEEGLAAGRRVVLRDTGRHIVQTYLVSDHLLVKLILSMKSIKDEGPNSHNSFGNLCLVVIGAGGTEKAVFVRRQGGIEALRNLGGVAPSGNLKADLADMRSQLEMLPK